MKKAVVILMLVIYGSATMGATIHMHYCMNRLISTNLWDGRGAVCDNCGMAKEKSHGCCKDECKQIRLQADQQLDAAEYSIQNFLIQAVQPAFISYATVSIPSATIVNQVSHAPPGLQKQKLYLQNGVWRI